MFTKDGVEGVLLSFYRTPAGAVKGLAGGRPQGVLGEPNPTSGARRDFMLLLLDLRPLRRLPTLGRQHNMHGGDQLSSVSGIPQYLTC